MRTDSDGPHSGPYVDCAPSLISSRLGSQRSRRFSVSSSTRMPTLTLPTKVPSDSLGWIGSLKRTSGKSLFPMALGSCGHRITHQLRPINMNGRSILSVTSTLQEPIQLLVELRGIELPRFSERASHAGVGTRRRLRGFDLLALHRQARAEAQTAEDPGLNRRLIRSSPRPWLSSDRPIHAGGRGRLRVGYDRDRPRWRRLFALRR